MKNSKVRLWGQQLLVFILTLVVATTVFAESKAVKADKISAALSLDQAYKFALERSDSLRIQEEQIKVAQAKYDEAFAGVLPNVHVIASERLQDSQGQSSQSNNTSSSPGNSNFSGRSRFQTYVSATQPIFQGFRDWYTIDAFKEDIAAKNYDLMRRHQLLYQDCAEVFYQILMYKGDIQELEVTKQIGEQRIEELRHFVDLGRSREAEILAVQSDLADLAAKIEGVKGFLAASKELLSFLTGIPSVKLVLANQNYAGPPALNVEVLIAQGQSRPDLLAAKSERGSMQHALKAAKAERWPALSVQGNAYPIENPDSSHDWDIMFRADLPIFEGGAISARIRQQESATRIADRQISETQRTIEREIRTARSDLVTARAQVTALEKLVAAAKNNYESQREDYKSGVVTNIDVLQAIKQMQDARIRLHDARMAAQIDAVKLSVAVGAIPQ